MAILAFLEDVFQKIKLAARGLTPKSTDNVPKNPNPIVDKEDEDVQDSETEKTLSGLAAEGEPEPEEEVEKEEVEEEEILSSSIQPPKTISHGQEGEVTSGFDTTTPPPPALEEDERRPIEIALEPVLIPPVLVSGTSVTHDESDGVQGSPAEDTTATLPLPFSTILGSLSELGHAWSLGKVIINAPAGIQNIALTNTATDSGLDTLDNKDILLSIDLTDDNIIWGKEAGTGDEVFALYLDETDNSLWLSQFQPIKHTPDTGPDQVATIADKIHVTVTDNNATTATAPLIINIVDDGIDLQLTPPTYDITHDESPGEQTGTSDDTNVANPPSWLGNLGTVVPKLP